jgi:CRP-like cAMP-binding protein
MKWDTLASLPLFMGMSQEELGGIMTQFRIDFKKYDAGKTIVKRGDPCGKLVIVNSGDILCQARSDDGAYSMEEVLSAPVMMQTDGIFGRFQVYTHTVKAVTPVSTLTFEKEEIQKLLASSLIFRLNLAGILSTKLQKSEQRTLGTAVCSSWFH